MADVATLNVLLRADDQLSAKLQATQGQLANTGRAATGMGHAMHGMAGQTKNAWMESMMLGMHIGATGKTLLALTGPLAAVGGLGVKAFMDFESSFAGVRKTVDATEEQFDELQAGLRRMAMEIPVSVNELNRIGEAAGQLGVKVADIETFTRTMADLGVTTNLSSDQAATALARLANITGLPQQEVGRLGSAIVALGNNLATTEAELVDFGLRIAGAGTIAGLTEAQILAIGGAMSSVGVQAEAGGTAVQKVLLAMTEQVATGGAQLEVFAVTAGMTAEQFSKAFQEDAAEAFTAFVEGLGAAGTDAFAILAELGLEDQRLMRSFLSLAGAGDMLRNSIEMGTEAFAANTALTEEARKRYQTAESQFILLKNSLLDVAITIGATLTPPMLTLIENVRPVLAGIGEWVKANPGLTQGLILAAGAITIVGTGLVALGLIIPGITGLMVGFGIAATVATGPIGILILAVGALGGSFLFAKTAWERTDKAFAEAQSTTAKMIPVIDSAAFSIRNLGDGTWELVPAMDKATSSIQGMTDSMREQAKQAWLASDAATSVLEGLERIKSIEAAMEPGTAMDEVRQRLEAMGESFQKWALDIMPVAAAMAEEFGITIGNALDRLAKQYLAEADVAMNNFGKAGEEAGTTLSSLGDETLNVTERMALLRKEFEQAQAASKGTETAFEEMARKLEMLGRPMGDLMGLAARLAERLHVDLDTALRMLASASLPGLDQAIKDVVDDILGLNTTLANTRTWTEPASSAYLDLAARMEALGRPMEDLLPLAQKLADTFAIDLGDAINLLAQDRLDMLAAELRDAVQGMRALGDEAEKTADTVRKSTWTQTQGIPTGTMLEQIKLNWARHGVELQEAAQLAWILGLKNVFGEAGGTGAQRMLRGALGIGEAGPGALALPLEEIARTVADLRKMVLLAPGQELPLDKLLSLLLQRWELPSFQGGGVVPGSIGQPVPILAHGGEVVSAHGRGGQTLVINTTINGPVYGITDLEQQVAQIWRDTAMAGGFRGLI